MNFHPNLDKPSEANFKKYVKPGLVSNRDTTMNKNNTRFQRPQLDKRNNRPRGPPLEIDDMRFERDNRRLGGPSMSRRPSSSLMNRRPQNFPMSRDDIRSQDTTIIREKMRPQHPSKNINERRTQQFNKPHIQLRHNNELNTRRNYSGRNFPDQKNFEHNKVANDRERDFSCSRVNDYSNKSRTFERSPESNYDLNSHDNRHNQRQGVNNKQNCNFDNEFQNRNNSRKSNMQLHPQDRFGSDHRNMTSNKIQGTKNFDKKRISQPHPKDCQNNKKHFHNPGLSSKNDLSFNSSTNKVIKQNTPLNNKGPVPLMSLKFDNMKSIKSHPNNHKHWFNMQDQTDISERQLNNRPKYSGKAGDAKLNRRINQNLKTKNETYAKMHMTESRFENRSYNNISQQSQQYHYNDSKNSSRKSSSDNSGFGPKGSVSVVRPVGSRRISEKKNQSFKNIDFANDFEQKNRHSFFKQQNNTKMFSNPIKNNQDFNSLNAQNNNSNFKHFNSSKKGVKRPGEPIEGSLNKKPSLLSDCDNKYHLKIHNLNLKKSIIYVGMVKQALMKIGKVKEIVSKDETQSAGKIISCVYVKFVKDVTPIDIIRAFYKGVLQLGNQVFTITVLGNTAEIEKTKENFEHQIDDEEALDPIPSNTHYLQQNPVKKQIRKIYLDLKDISSTNYGYSGSHLWMKPLPSNNQLVQNAVLDFFKKHGVVEKLYIRKNLFANDPNYTAFVRYQHESSIAKFIQSKPQMMKFPPKFEDCQYGITCMFNRNLKTREKGCPFAYEEFTADSNVVVKRLPHQGPAIQNAILKMVEEYQAAPKVRFTVDLKKNIYDAHITIPDVNIAEEFLITNSKFKFMKNFYQLRGSTDYRDFLDKGRFGVMEKVETSSDDGIEEEEERGDGCGVFDDVCPDPYSQAKFTGNHHIWVEELILSMQHEIQPMMYNFMERFGYIDPIATIETGNGMYRAMVKFKEDHMADQLLRCGEQFKAVGKVFTVKSSRQYKMHIYNVIVNMRD